MPPPRTAESPPTPRSGVLGIWLLAGALEGLGIWPSMWQFHRAATTTPPLPFPAAPTALCAMNHRALVRPVLPGTTPAPAPMGKSSVYATRVPALLDPISPNPQADFGSPFDATNNDNYNQAHMSGGGKIGQLNSPMRDIRTPSETIKQRSLQEKALNRMTAKLPFELRESVSAVVRMAFTASQRMQEDLDLNNQELLVLRSEVSEKTRDNHMLQKSCENYREQLRGMQENVDSLKDEIATRQNFTIRNRSAMTRLASTNRMLIDVLDALQTAPSQGNSKGNSKLLQELARQAEIDVEDEALTETSDKQALRRPGKLAPIVVRGGKGNQGENYEDKDQRQTMFQNDKLRESLLKVAREHYRSTKNAQVLEAKVIELKASLRAQEMTNRKLKSELDEMKVIHRVDTEPVDDGKPSNESASVRIRSFGQLDQRFQALLDRNVFDPLDGILQLRRILSHMASAPSSLSLADMIDHIINPEVMRIFDADMVCLYLVKPGSETTSMHKFTTRSKTPITIDMVSTRSLAAETIRSGKAQRLNIVSNSPSYHPDVDGCVGVITKRIMSLPLFHSQNLEVLGAVQFLNKAQGKDAFAEVDELFGLIFSNQAAVYLTECVMYDAMFFHAQLLQGLLEASTDLFSIVPDPQTVMTHQVLSPGEILEAMERISRELLKCPHTRAFFVSEVVMVGEQRQLLMLQHSRSSSMSKHQQSTDIVQLPLNSGIAGHCIATKQPYLMESGALDEYWNPITDLDPLNNAMLTVPLMDLHGNILGCLQLLASSRSPRIKQSNDVSDFRMLFSQAAHWLAHQMAPALVYLLSYVGKTALHPAATPSKMTRKSTSMEFRPTFLSSSDEAVTQVLAAEQGTYRDSAGFISMPPQAVADIDLFPARVLTGDSERRVHFPSGDVAPLATDVAPGVDALLYEEALARADRMENEARRQAEELEAALTRLADREAAILRAEEERVAATGQCAQLEAHFSELQAQASSLDMELQAMRVAQKRKDSDAHALQERVVALTNERDVAQQAVAQLRGLQNDQDKASADQLLEATREKDRLACANAEQRAEIGALQSASREQETQLAQVRAALEKLKADLAQKDKVQAILQEQVVKLAGQNIKDLIDKDKKPTDTALPTPVPAAVPVPAIVTVPTSVAVVAETAAAPVPASAPPPASASQTAGAVDMASAAEAKAPVSSLSGTAADTPLADNFNAPASVATAPSAVSPRPSAKNPMPPRPESRPPASAPPSASASVTSAVPDGAPPTGASKQPSIASLTSLSAALNDWTQQTDEQGQVYYYNPTTGESSWTIPDSSTPAPITKGDWMQQFDEFGREYWVSQTTGESAWEAPADADAGADEQDQEDEEDPDSGARRGQPSIYDTNASQFSATAGDYTIEL